jgi:O-antigen/teichoic acid export membrane protein
LSIFQSLKGLFRNSVIYGISHMLSRFINFLLLPLYTHVLPRNEYGVVGLFFTYIAILFVMYTYGLSSAFFRFFMDKEEGSNKHRVCSTTFFTLAGTSLFFSSILILFATPISVILFSSEVREMGLALSFMIRMAGIILFFDSLGLLGYLIILSDQKPGLFALLKFIFVTVNVGGNIVLVVVLKRGIEGIFIANAIASGISLVSVLPIIIPYLRPQFSLRLLKELLSFGIPYIVVNASVVIMDTIDRPLLERLASIEQAGLFNAGVKLGMFMAIFVSAFRFAWMPFFMSHIDKDNAKLTFSKVMTYLMAVCLTVFLLLSFYIDQIARFKILGRSLVGPEFWDSTVVVPPVLMAYVFYAAYLCFIIGIYIKKRTIYLSYITAAGMIGNILLNFLLIPWIGMMGAAWARLGAYLIMAISLYFVSNRLYPIRYEWKRLIKLGLVTAVLYTIGIQLPMGYRVFLVLGMPVWLGAVNFWQAAEIERVRMVFKKLIHGATDLL